MTIAWDIDSNLETVTILDNDLSLPDDIIDNQGYVDFEIISTDEDVIVPEISVITNIVDKIMLVTTPTHTRHNKQLSINLLSGHQTSSPLWTNADRTGRVFHRVNGDVLVNAVVGGTSHNVNLNFTGIPTAIQQQIGCVVGYVRENATTAIDRRLALGGSKLIYTTQDHSTPIYVRNSSCWCADLDLTCISPWNSGDDNHRAGTLITPRHILFAKHYTLTTGNTIRFITLDNTVVTRTVGSILNPWLDISVAILDSDVPNTIRFAKVLPSDYRDYFSHNGIPVLCTDQEEKALCLDSIGDGGLDFPTDATRLEYCEVIIGGDSGNPIFLVINNELVLLGTFWSYLSYPSIFTEKHLINDALTTLGGGYQLTEIDLSSYLTL